MSISTLSTSFDTNTGKRPKKNPSPNPRRNSSGPFISPFDTQRNSPLPRDKCKATTETEHRKDLKRLKIYRQWFHENIMTPNADAILVLPCGKSSRVEHRDEAVAYV